MIRELLPKSVKEKIFNPDKKPLSGLDVILAGHILQSLPQVSGIETFGSIPKDGRGNDIDLILIVPNEIALEFLNRMRYQFEEKKRLLPRGRARTRKYIAGEILGAGFTSLINEMEKTKPEARFDVFLLPSDWKNRTDELERYLTNNPDGFLGKIAKGALKILPS